MPYTFTMIDPPGSIFTQQFGINAKGDIVGGYQDRGNKWHGYVYSAGAFRILDFPGSTTHNTLARSIGPSGDIVGHYNRIGEPSVAWHGFLLTNDDRWSEFGDPGHLYTIPTCILSDGTMVGCVHDNDTMGSMHGVIYDRAGNTVFPQPNSMHNGATPDRKMIVGQYTTPDPTGGWGPGATLRGYLLDDGNFTPFDVPDSSSTAALGISPSGVIVGYYNDNSAAKAAHGFMVQPQRRPVGDWQFTTVDVPGEGRTLLRGINPGGNLVGVCATSLAATSTTLNAWHGFLAKRTPP